MRATVVSNAVMSMASRPVSPPRAEKISHADAANLR
jgi:hypothetical protein